MAFYVSGVRELLLQETEALFNSELEIKRNGYDDIPPWSEAFINYFDKNILPDIESMAKYAILPIVGEHFNAFNGVTTNHAEGLNNLSQNNFRT